RCVSVSMTAANTRSKKSASRSRSPASASGKSKRKRCASCAILRGRGSCARSSKVRRAITYRTDSVPKSRNAPSYFWGRFCFGKGDNVRCILRIQRRGCYESGAENCGGRAGCRIGRDDLRNRAHGESASAATKKARKAAAGQLVDQTALANARQL